MRGGGGTVVLVNIAVECYSIYFSPFQFTLQVNFNKRIVFKNPELGFDCKKNKQRSS